MTIFEAQRAEAQRAEFRAATAAWEAWNREDVRAMEARRCEHGGNGVIVCDGARHVTEDRHGRQINVSMDRLEARRGCDAEALSFLSDPTTSDWLRDALQEAMKRDPVDAALDASALLAVLSRRSADIARLYGRA